MNYKSLSKIYLLKLREEAVHRLITQFAHLKHGDCVTLQTLRGDHVTREHNNITFYIYMTPHK